ncbi:hypothetical protein AM500_16845 [Bacillus sp. FJAT-18017]|uniref:DUF1450 domain-containing protein n=1 Tax=Bacillus sp. FJAT-18017 TaxID=1705566 RepID=UPI0006AEE8E3|nr:DUF1450 domain-containing protein [Bacillus sp. FJAT-18017]ALC91273.1 hypothetical protein AM500_16845 [Bacillus sp. FJAT-18017]
MKLFSALFPKQKKVKVEFCEKNLDRFLTEENFAGYQSFMSRKNVFYKEYECQSLCKECKLSPYALVDGDFISAGSSGELLERLKKLAEDEE